MNSLIAAVGAVPANAGAVKTAAILFRATRRGKTDCSRTLRCSGSAQPPRLQSGVGLIEVMVAVLVLSIAFLGIAALQAVSLSTSNSAMARSMATIASYSILDAMRADSANARAGLYNTTVATSACPSAVSGSLFNTQIIQWCAQLGTSLGTSAQVTGAISCTGTAGACTVTITFDDSRSGLGGSSKQTVTTQAVI